MKPCEDWSEDTAERAEQAIGYVFKNKKLLKECFTHRSFANLGKGKDNERLEFLGDAVIQFIVTEALYLRSNGNEGRMTEERQHYVSREALGNAAKRAGLMPFLLYAGGADTVGGKTPCNLFEAVSAGIFLDGGLRAVRTFLKKFLTMAEAENYTTLLQEYVQERNKKLPVYRVSGEENRYECTVTALGREARGTGESKKAARSAAAEALYRAIKER